MRGRSMAQYSRLNAAFDNLDLRTMKSNRLAVLAASLQCTDESGESRLRGKVLLLQPIIMAQGYTSMSVCRGTDIGNELPYMGTLL